MPPFLGLCESWSSFQTDSVLSGGSPNRTAWRPSSITSSAIRILRTSLTSRQISLEKSYRAGIIEIVVVPTFSCFLTTLALACRVGNHLSFIVHFKMSITLITSVSLSTFESSFSSKFCIGVKALGCNTNGWDD